MRRRGNRLLSSHALLRLLARASKASSTRVYVYRLLVSVRATTPLSLHSHLAQADMRQRLARFNQRAAHQPEMREERMSQSLGASQISSPFSKSLITFSNVCVCVCVCVRVRACVRACVHMYIVYMYIIYMYICCPLFLSSFTHCIPLYTCLSLSLVSRHRT
jgi:hypothetical protein